MALVAGATPGVPHLGQIKSQHLPIPDLELKQGATLLNESPRKKLLDQNSSLPENLNTLLSVFVTIVIVMSWIGRSDCFRNRKFKNAIS